MKNLLKTIFILMMIGSSIQACDIELDNCSQMQEPCEPIDLCAEACDPITD